MGSEQSQQQGGPGGAVGAGASAVSRGRHAAPPGLQRGKSVPERGGPAGGGGGAGAQEDAGNRPGSISPGPSICSDSDLPYISYTVNRPIGDSPKLPSKQAGHLQRGKSLGTALGGGAGAAGRRSGGVIPKRQFTVAAKAPVHNIVVVKAAAAEQPTEKDEDLVKLQAVPMFLPIMRGTLNLPAVRDPEVLERLDPNGFLSLCVRYQQHVKLCSDAIAADQTQLSYRIKDIDSDITRLMALMTDRQKRYAKYAEKLNKVHEISHQLNRCHTALNQTLESMETLNNALPPDERLEPFVWTTG